MREHSALLTFFACNDYNLFYIKIEKFFILFCVDMTMSGLFFVHETMHRKYTEGENFTFVQKLPQLLFTLIVAHILEVILCFLSFTDTHVYEIKNLPNDISKEELKNIIEPLGNINFIYIPLLIKNKNKLTNNLPCAYINVINYKSILKIIEKFGQIKRLSVSNTQKDFSNVEIFYSGTQGKNALINRFRLEKKYLPPNQSISFS